MRKNLDVSLNEFVCQICSGTKQKMVFKGSDQFHEIPGEFYVYECENCHLFTTHPILSSDEIEKFYPEDYLCYLPAIEDETNLFRKIDRSFSQKKRINIIQKKPKGKGRILDIGCATGIDLSGLQKEGWECFGVEPNSMAAEYARERFGLNVINGYLEDIKFQDNYFDLVTIFDVLEHVPNPISFVSEVHRILKPSGWLIATLPNSDALERHIFGKYWLGWDIPRHYRTFNPKNIKAFLSTRNFHNIHVFSFTGRHGAFMMSLRFWLKSEKNNRLDGKLMEFIFGSFVLRIIMLPLFLLLEKINKSTIMSFYAQKK